MEFSSAAAVRPSPSSLFFPARGTAPLDEPPRAKFLCSFGGRILPRPLDGKLRYVGGETRIVSVPRDVTYGELMARMRELFEGAWCLKYQQPEEDLDALVSVVNDDDVANMMEEHEKLAGGGDGFTRLRVFLFPHPDHDTGAASPSVTGVCFDSADERETENMYVDALNSPMDVKPQFPGDVLGGIPMDGGRVLGASDQFFGHGGIDAGLNGLFKLHHPDPQHLHGQRHGEMEGPWSPGYCSPGHRTPNGLQEFPPSPSSGGYHPGFAETNGTIPDEHVRQSSPHQAMQYDHHSVFADDVVCLPSGCVAGEKLGFPGNLGQTPNFYEPGSRCEHCRMALRRNQAVVPEDRIFDCWMQGQTQLEQFNAGSGLFGQFPNSSCAECLRSREAYLLHHHIRLDHSAYVKEQSERNLFYNGLQSHESDWAVNHHRMNHSPDEPRVRQSQQCMADSNGIKFPFAHGDFYGRHAVTPSYISHEDSCYVHSAVVPGSGGYNDQQLVGGGTHIQVEDKRTQYLKSPAYGADSLYEVEHGSSSISYSGTKMQGVCSIPSCEVPGMVMQTHGAVNMDYTRTTPEGSPRFSPNGVDVQIPSPCTVQSANASQKILPMDGHFTHEYNYDYSSKPQEGNQEAFIPECVSSQPGKRDYSAPSGAVNVATPPDSLVGDKSFPSPLPVYHPNPAAAIDVTMPVVDEINLTGGAYGTSDVKVVNGFDADKIHSRGQQDSDSDPKESWFLGMGDNSSKFGCSNACVPCEEQELSAEDLSFLPELIASVKKATLQGIEMVKSEAEANAVDNTSPDHSRKPSSLHGSAPVAASGGGDVLLDTEHETISKIEPTMAEAEALARGLQTIKNDDLEEIRELGSGTFGAVYHGKWKGSDVAIKRIKASCFAGRPSERERLIADFWKEALIMSSLHHPNVVAFYGIVRDGPDGSLATVTEFMVNGSLKQFLQKKDRTIDRRKRLIIAMDVAFGMEYLHEKNIVHFDLKCENLLVNMRDPHRPVCKIGDLGLSKVKQKTLVSGGVRGTLPWMAPELLSGKSNMVTEKIDVYSFGIVMWELLTGEEPYSDMHCASIIGGIVNGTLRPQIPTWCDPEWRSLMESCWSSDPADRPSFSEISQRLRKMAAAINVK